MTRSAVLTAALVLAAATPTFARPIGGEALGTQSLGAGASNGPAVHIQATSQRWARDLGPAPAALPVQLAVLLKYRHQAELDALVVAQRTPRSPLYNRFLSSDQFNAYFAPDPAGHTRVIAALQRAGFTVTNTATNRTIIDVQAPAATAARYFNTDIHRVVEPSGAVRYANVTPATLPAELQDTVRDVSGLNNLSDGFKTFSHKRLNRSPEGAQGPGNDLSVPDVSGPLLGPGGSGYGPLATAKAYDLPVQHTVNGHLYDGHGMNVGIAIWGSISGTDLGHFERYFHVARRGTTYIKHVDGGGHYGDPGSDEATLDTETIVGNAPGANVWVYTIPNGNDGYILDDYNAIVSQDVVSVVNSSFGQCETADTGFDGDMQSVIEQGNSLGITFSAASGDDGAYGCGAHSSKGVSYPASDPLVTSVGGTALHVDSSGKWTSETGWSGSGGGVSQVFDEPFYQVLIPGPSPNGRNVPDVSFVASSSTPAAIYYEGNWYDFWGTSWASPINCALQAEINQYNGNRMGSAAALLYVENQLFGYAEFHDIKSGNNGYYGAHSGYDHVTGIGSIRGWTFTKDQ